MIILLFFAVHWQLAVFFQSFFLHRYIAHRQFTMSKGWVRFFHVCTNVVQGPSFTSARGYAVLHRMHHAFSDTPRDPHAPTNHRGVLPLFVATKKRYDDYAYRRVEPEPRFDTAVPDWPLLERLGQSWTLRISWGALQTLFYARFVTHSWMWALLPIHFLMGPVQGVIVNWCGHRYGYRNFASDDASRNTLPFDFVTGGELLQNNHHKFPMSPNLGARWFEVDLVFQIMRVLQAARIIDMRGGQVMRMVRRG